MNNTPQADYFEASWATMETKLAQETESTWFYKTNDGNLHRIYNQGYYPDWSGDYYSTEIIGVTTTMAFGLCAPSLDGIIEELNKSFGA